MPPMPTEGLSPKGAINPCRARVFTIFTTVLPVSTIAIPLFFIQPDVFHITYIDDNSPVDLGEICFQRMPSAPGANGDSVLTGPSDGVCYILRPLGKHKHFGKSVRMGIPILARPFIARIPSEDDPPGQPRF